MVRSRSSSAAAAGASAPPIDLDAILDELDERWQYRTYSWSLLAAVLMLASVPLLSYIFTAGQLNHRCRVPQCDVAETPDGLGSTEFHPSWLTNAVPRRSDDPAAFSACERFAYVGGSCDNHSAFDQSLIERCPTFVYETPERTIGREFNITCTDDADVRLALVGTLNYAAGCLLLPLCAAASDRYGRRPVLLANLALTGAAGLAKSFAGSYAAFAALEFAGAAVSAGTFMTVLVLAIESSAPAQRVRIGTLLSAVYSGSQVVCGLLAAWQPDFRLLLRWLFAPNAVLLTFVWLVPESVRWLLVQHRRPELQRVLERAAAWNGRPLCGRAWTELQESTSATSESGVLEHLKRYECSDAVGDVEADDVSGPLAGALRSGRLRVRLLNCLLAWFAASFVYYGMNVQAVAALGGSKYVNFAAVNLVELPAILAANRLMQRAGRRRVLSAALCAGAVTLLATHFTVGDAAAATASSATAQMAAGWLRLVLFVTGKGAVTLALTVLYVYTAEMFPTRTRQTFVNVCSTSGAIGAMLAPMSTLLAAVWPPLPMIVFGGAALTAGVAALGLPETLGRRLPDTVREAERLAEKN